MGILSKLVMSQERRGESFETLKFHMDDFFDSVFGVMLAMLEDDDDDDGVAGDVGVQTLLSTHMDGEYC